MKPLQRFMRLWRDAEFRAGARDMSSVAPGLASWGLMTGVAMANSGMSTLEVLLMGVLVYAGALDDQGDKSPKNYVVNAIQALKDGKDVSPATTKPYGCGVKYGKGK